MKDELHERVTALLAVDPEEKPVVPTAEMQRLIGELRLAIEDGEGKPTGMRGISRDLAERKRAEEALRASEERFRNLFQNMGCGVAVYEAVDDGRDFVLKDFNTAGERIEQISRERVIGRRVTEVFPGVEDLGLLDVFRRVWKTGAAEDHPISQYKDNRISGWRENRVYRLPSGEIVAVYDDVTARKQADDALRESEERLRRTQEIAHLGSWELDLVRNRLTWSDEVYRIFGLRPQEFGATYEAFLEHVHPEDRWKVDDAYSNSLFEDRDTYEIEHRVVRRGTGEVRVVQEKCLHVRDANGRIVRSIGMVHDITERHESEARYRLLFESTTEGMALADAATGILMDCNPALCRMVEREKSELVGQPQSILHPPQQLVQGVTRLFRHHLDAADGATTEDLLLSKSGRTFSVEISTAHVLMGGRDCLLGIFHDLTQRKQAEEERERDITREQELKAQLRQAQRLESVGRLAGGVAHDFNNLLSVIIGYAELACKGLHMSDPIRKDVIEIKQAGQRAAALTKQLLAFSRKQVLMPRVIDLNRVISDVEKMLGRLLGEDIDISLHLPEDLGSVMADPGQIEQVIVNICVNARDAMSQGGKLTIETANTELDQEYASRHAGVTPGHYVMLSITDTGRGMDTGTLEHIFEPFFTTKEKGKGTGLGLATVHGIVKQSGGDIRAYSEPGRGTTFKIYLPQVDGPAVDVRPKPAATMATGSETVLIVEDEDAVRELAELILRQAGYTVHSAANGGEALLLCEKHGAFDLLLTDVVMPRMSGRELAERLAGTLPGLRVLYMSGYTDEAIVHHGVLTPGTRFIGKPFSTADLTRKVREVLDEGG